MSLGVCWGIGRRRGVIRLARLGMMRMGWRRTRRSRFTTSGRREVGSILRGTLLIFSTRGTTSGRGYTLRAGGRTRTRTGTATGMLTSSCTSTTTFSSSWRLGTRETTPIREETILTFLTPWELRPRPRTSCPSELPSPGPLTLRPTSAPTLTRALNTSPLSPPAGPLRTAARSLTSSLPATSSSRRTPGWEPLAAATSGTWREPPWRLPSPPEAPPSSVTTSCRASTPPERRSRPTPSRPLEP
mmetsp:Transcript_10071/g.18253  ORF Transcript_10071/g.18253 Transcript_10071/m.18253 type:complete len:244 (-) Transcript_10071:1210-1941(-)